MELNFEKWHGCGNDFLVFWVDQRQDILVDSLVKKAVDFCSRRGPGIGADGVLIIGYLPHQGDTNKYSLTIVNSDGSLAKTCGNGIRCAAASVLKRFHAKQKAFEELEGVEFVLDDRTVVVQFLVPLKATESFRVPLMSVEMGVPLVNENTDWFEDAKKEVARVLSECKSKIKVQEVGVCEIGNRHLVLFCDRVERESIYEIGPRLQKSRFWDGINVHLVEACAFPPKETHPASRVLPVNKEEYLNVQIWERGAGPTAACGSGACAIVACSYTSSRSERKGWMVVRMPGGDLFVKQGDLDEPCMLAGPAAFVFEGRVFI